MTSIYYNERAYLSPVYSKMHVREGNMNTTSSVHAVSQTAAPNAFTQPNSCSLTGSATAASCPWPPPSSCLGERSAGQKAQPSANILKTAQVQLTPATLPLQLAVKLNRPYHCPSSSHTPDLWGATSSRLLNSPIKRILIPNSIFHPRSFT